MCSGWLKPPSKWGKMRIWGTVNVARFCWCLAGWSGFNKLLIYWDLHNITTISRAHRKRSQKRENVQFVAVTCRRNRLVGVPGVWGDTCGEKSSLPRQQSTGIKNWLQRFMRSLNLKSSNRTSATTFGVDAEMLVWSRLRMAFLWFVSAMGKFVTEWRLRLMRMKTESVEPSGTLLYNRTSTALRRRYNMLLWWTVKLFNAAKKTLLKKKNSF